MKVVNRIEHGLIQSRLLSHETASPVEFYVKSIQIIMNVCVWIVCVFVLQ